MLGINYRDGRPIYEQVVDEIEHMVVHGVLEPDSQLPSVRQMAAELSINPNTIQRAYSELESRGVIYSVKGKGNFVSPNAAALRERRLRVLQGPSTELVRSGTGLGGSDAPLMGSMKAEGEIE